MTRQSIVSGDIGGTNTRFAFVEYYQGEVTTLLQKEYRNADYPSFTMALQAFLSEVKYDSPPDCACFAVAGPVSNNKVRFTNRESWSIDGDELQTSLNIEKVRLVNDFLAVGYGLLTLNEENECYVLQAAKKQKDAPIACIGAGTGLGECFLTPDIDGTYTCFPSEGGHAEFAPRDEIEVELLHHLKERFVQRHRISVERVVSGSGLANVYEFLAVKFPEQVDAKIATQISEAGDMKGAIIAKAADNQDPLCIRTMEIFTRAYGSEAGVAALKWMPCGGLYLTGGLTPKNLKWIKSPAFMEALLDKGRVSGMLSSIPIYAVLVENLGERGAQYFALKMAADLRGESHHPTAPMASAAATSSVGSQQWTWAAVGLAVGVTVGMFAAKFIRK